jgi:hypothetical protein
VAGVSDGDGGSSVFIVSAGFVRFTVEGRKRSFTSRQLGIGLLWFSGVAAGSVAEFMPKEILGVVVAVFQQHDGQRSDRVMAECEDSDGPV